MVKKMTKEKKKKDIFNKIYNLLGIETLIFQTGKYVALIVGTAIIIEKLLDVYYLIPPTTHPNIVALGFMFAVVSVPISLAAYFLDKIFGEEDD